MAQKQRSVPAGSASTNELEIGEEVAIPGIEDLVKEADVAAKKEELAKSMMSALADAIFKAAKSKQKPVEKKRSSGGCGCGGW